MTDPYNNADVDPSHNSYDKSNTTNIVVIGALEFRQDFDDGGALLYVGEALPGTGASDPYWRIKKYFYNSSGKLILVSFAGKGGRGTGRFDKVWTQRGTYNYEDA